MVDKPRGKKSAASKGAVNRKPNRPPARPRPRSIDGINEDSLEKLHEHGLLSTEGRLLRQRAQNAAAAGPGQPQRKSPAPRPTVERRGQRPTAPALQRFSPAEASVAQRLHKVMAHAGLASRRHSEALIQAGRVSVNGVIVKELGAKAIPGRDLIEVDGRPLGQAEDQVYIMLNKPKGYVTTLFDPQGRQTVTDLIGDDVAERIYPVGRLDYETEGLLLLTNDGELANALMHPARMIKKTYIAKVRGVPGPAKIKALEGGIELEDGMTAPAEVKVMEVKGPNAAILSVKIHEGRNRQVRRMLEAIGHETIHLKRLSLGPLHLQELPLGQWRRLDQTEVSALKLAVGLKQNPPRVAGNLRTGGPVSIPARPRSDRPARPERSARSEGPARPERPARSEGPARPERSARSEGPARPARVSAIGLPRPAGSGATPTPHPRTGLRTADNSRPQRPRPTSGPKRGTGPKKFGPSKTRTTK